MDTFGKSPGTLNGKSKNKVLCNSVCPRSPLVGSETIAVAFSFRAREVFVDIFDVDAQIRPMRVSQIQADTRCAVASGR